MFIVHISTQDLLYEIYIQTLLICPVTKTFGSYELFFLLHFKAFSNLWDVLMDVEMD